MDDVWKDISSLIPSLHHPTTSHHFQDFFAPTGARPDGRAANTLHQPQPPPPPPPPPPQLPLVTISSLSSTSGSYSRNDHQQAMHINDTTLHVVKERPPAEYSEKFKRLMKNRESAVRSRARKQARANELEQEILRLTKENAKLKRLQKELCSTKGAQRHNEHVLHRTRSSPF